MEHLLNVYASRASKHSIADFVGFCEVEAEEATRSLTEGLWLVSTSCYLSKNYSESYVSCSATSFSGVQAILRSSAPPAIVQYKLFCLTQLDIAFRHVPTVCRLASDSFLVAAVAV